MKEKTPKKTNTIYIRFHCQLFSIIEQCAKKQGITKARWISRLLEEHANRISYETTASLSEFSDSTEIYRLKKGRASSHAGSSLGRPILVTVDGQTYRRLVWESMIRNCTIVELCRKIVAQEVLSFGTSSLHD